MANTPFFARNGLNVNNFIQANGSVLTIGANIAINSSAISIGNSSGNAVVNSSAFQFSNSTANITFTFTGLTIGNSVVNSSQISVGSNNVINSSAHVIGNSSVNISITSTQISVGSNVSVNSLAVSTGNTSILSSGIKFPDGQNQNTAAYGRQSLWIPAGGMKSRANSGAVANTFESSSNFQNFDVFDFDPSVNNFVQFNIRMPKSWNGGNVSAQFVWLQPNTSANFGVTWSIAGTSFSNTSLIDSVMGTAIQVTSNGAVNNSVYVSPETSNVTISGASTQGMVNFEIKRVATDAGDTMTIPAKLLGVTLYLTSNAVNDA